MKFLPWKADNWLSRQGNVFPWDKLEHFIRDFILFIAFSGLISQIAGNFFVITLAYYIGMGAGYIFTTIFMFMWEFKDGTTPYDGINIQGFNWKDIIAGQAGVLLGVLLFLRIML